ncbi:hypothetical protein, partial [uncultured Porphyromonas sp.]|uniref:hypothetical protein n=1 Tax=uncultured Porphyromonas sp. TaxID=159274 RepID=UPI002615EAF7
GGSPHPDERFTRRAVDRTYEMRKKLRFLLAYELRKQRATRIELTQRAYRPDTESVSRWHRERIELGVTAG